MRKLCIIAGLVMLAGCKASHPANNDQSQATVSTEQTVQESTSDNPSGVTNDSFAVVKICKDGTKIYQLTGGNSDSRYAVWDTAGKGSWELLAASVTPDTVCSN